MVWIQKEYLNCDWNSGTNIWMEDFQWIFLLDRKVFFKFTILAELLLAEKLSKLVGFFPTVET